MSTFLTPAVSGAFFCPFYPVSKNKAISTNYCQTLNYIYLLRAR